MKRIPHLVDTAVPGASDHRHFVTRSEPTERSILHADELMAFTKEHCFEAYLVGRQFRRQRRAISDGVDLRNDGIDFEYNHRKPQNIDHSISI